MDETSGSSVADSSGNGNTGTASGTTIVDGKYGKARSFNGSNSYTEIPHSSSLNLSTAITVEAWVNPAATKYNMISSKADDGSGNNDWYFALGSGGCVGSLISFYWSGSGWICGTTNVSNNVWTHVAVTWDGSAVNLYFNGNSNRAPFSLSGARATNAAPVRIGSYQSGADTTNFNGIIDEVRVYNRALSSAEISDLYNYYGYTTTNYLGRVLVRKFSSPEPAFGTWGSEESSGQ